MKKLLLAAGLLVMAAGQSAEAVQIKGTEVDAKVGGSAWTGDHITRLNFNTSLGNDDVAVSLYGGAGAVNWFGGGLNEETGFVDYYAPPALSGGNSDGFGDSPTGENGWTKTRFLQTGHADKPEGSRISFEFNQAQDYFGLLWGSIDSFNNIAFYLGTTQVNIFNGGEIATNADGNQNQNGTYYVNFSDISFNRVVMWSDNYSFEFDNVAYGRVSNGVPDGGFTAALLGISISGMALLRRKIAA